MTASYTVTVTVALSSAKAITAFSFPRVAATGTIDEAAKTISVTVPFGTSLWGLVATFTTTGSSVKVGSTLQVSGTTANNFTSPVTYTVTAADGSTAGYRVTVIVVPAKAITAFSFPKRTAAVTIDEGAKTIAVTVFSGTDVTALVATFTTTGSSIKVGSTVQVSGVTANNFTSPVVYTVTAADGLTANYTATVTVAPQGWWTVGAAGFSAMVPDSVSIAIDPTGVPYVAYTVYGFGYRATVVRYDGEGWRAVGTMGFSAGEAHGISLAFDPWGTPTCRTRTRRPGIRRQS